MCDSISITLDPPPASCPLPYDPHCADFYHGLRVFKYQLFSLTRLNFIVQILHPSGQLAGEIGEWVDRHGAEIQNCYLSLNSTILLTLYVNTYHVFSRDPLMDDLLLWLEARGVRLELQNAF